MEKVSQDPMATRTSTEPVEDALAWRQQTMRSMLRAALVIGTFALAVGLSQLQSLWMGIIYVAAYLVLVVIVFWQRVPHTVRAVAVLALVYGLGVFNLFEDGLAGDGRVYFLTLPFLAILLYNWRAAIVALVLAAFTLGVFAWAFSTGSLSIDETFAQYTGNGMAWLSGILVFVMMSAMTVISQGNLLPRLSAALSKSQGLVEQLQEFQNVLRERAEKLEATSRLLEERNRILQATAEVTHEAISILDLQELVTRIAALISDRFGFYHTGIFLVDPSGEWAELRAASGETGRQMLARGYRVRVGAPGLVGHVTGQGQWRIASPVQSDAALPELALTRTQLTLPLRARGRIMGALDMHNQSPQALSDDNVAVLQTLADQVALAISNALLFQQTQESLTTEQQAYGNLARQAWQELARSGAQPNLVKRYDPQGLLVDEDQWREAARRAMLRGEGVQSKTKSATLLATPIQVRNQAVGVLNAYKSAEAGEWTEEEMALLETLTGQFATALESARLYQDTQHRAAREQLISTVTSRVRESLDMETVLKTAAKEMRQALGLDKITVHLGVPKE